MNIDVRNDLLTTGKIVCLQILKEEKENSGSIDDVDFQYLIDVELRNLQDPTILKSIVMLDESDDKQ